MPAKKSAALNRRNDTKADKAARAAAESAMTPVTELTLAIPHILRGREHAKAKATWKRIIALFKETEVEQDGKMVGLATAFDKDLLIKYCLLEEECDQLALMRKHVHQDWEKARKSANRIKPTSDTLKDWVAMWGIVNALFSKFQGMDARLDGKRKLLLTMSQSLYLTPRSRAGVAPPTREPEKPKTQMEMLLDG